MHSSSGFLQLRLCETGLTGLISKNLRPCQQLTQLKLGDVFFDERRNFLTRFEFFKRTILTRFAKEGGDDFYTPWLKISRLKREIHSKYNILPPMPSFPYPLGSTNVPSQACLKYVPLSDGRTFRLRADEKHLCWRFAVTQSFNLAVRRSQIFATQERSFASVPFASLDARMSSVCGVRVCEGCFCCTLV